MSAYIYLFCNRVVYWTPQTPFSRPATLPETSWYTVHGEPPVPFDDMVRQGNYGYSLQEGFYISDEVLPSGWSNRDSVVQKLQILGAFNTLANTQKLQYTDNSLGQPLTDILVLREVEKYDKTKSLENCPILASLLETADSGLSPAAFIAKLRLQYESYSAVIAYLNRLEFNIRQFLKAGDIEKASTLLNSEFEKIGV